MKKNRMLGVIWQVIVAIFLLLPLTVSFIYSFAGRWTSILPQNLTFRFYLDKFKDSTFFLGILRGIFISALPVILVNIIILLTLFAVIVYFPKMEKIHSGLLYYSDYHQRYYFSNFDFVHLCRKRHHIFQPDYYADVYLLYFLPSPDLSGHPQQSVCSKYQNAFGGGFHSWCQQILRILKNYCSDRPSGTDEHCTYQLFRPVRRFCNHQDYCFLPIRNGADLPL